MRMRINDTIEVFWKEEAENVGLNFSILIDASLANICDVRVYGFSYFAKFHSSLIV